MSKYRLRVVREKIDNTVSPVYNSSADVYNDFKDQMMSYDREHFIVLHFNIKNKLIGQELVAIGTIDNIVLPARQVFTGAVLNNSSGIIMIHNHPSGISLPSPADIDCTKKFVELARIFGIVVMDHIIFGDNEHFSMTQHGYIPSGASIIGAEEK